MRASLVARDLAWRRARRPAPCPRPFPSPGGACRTRRDPADPAPAASAPRTAPRRGSGWLLDLVDGAVAARRALPQWRRPIPAGFDCSGFVQYVFEQHGVAMPRDIRRQFEVGSEVDRRAGAGDLVFFTTVAPGASHVGIAVGGDQFVHAPSTQRRRARRTSERAVLGESIRRREAGRTERARSGGELAPRSLLDQPRRVPLNSRSCRSSSQRSCRDGVDELLDPRLLQIRLAAAGPSTTSR